MKFSFPVIPEHFSLPRLWSQLIKDLSCSTSVWKKTVNRSRFYSHLFNHNCTSVKQVLVLLFTNQFASCVMVLMFMYSTSCYCWAGLIDYYIMWVCKLPRNIFFFNNKIYRPELMNSISSDSHCRSNLADGTPYLILLLSIHPFSLRDLQLYGIPTSLLL